MALWTAVGAVVALSQLRDPDIDAPVPASVAPIPDAPAPPWSHPAVRVLATRPPRPAATAAAGSERLSTKHAARGVPRPFAPRARSGAAFASPLLEPRLRLPPVLTKGFAAIGGLRSRAEPGQPVAVRLSAYCLRGRTRRGLPVRTGIIAADPRVFPLARHVELYASGRYLGKYLVDDTGRHIRGTRIDIWTPDCGDARRFGMRDGVAALVASDDKP